MFKPFCDRCGNPAVKGGNRTFPKIFKVEAVHIGASITPLFNGNVSPDSHLCDGCLPDLLFAILKEYKDHEVIRDYLDASTSDSQAALRERLAEKMKRASEREAEAEQRLNEAEALIEDANKQRRKDEERVALLTAQVNALQAKLTSYLKVKEATEAQRKIDEKENPEYINRVAKRERLRASE